MTGITPRPELPLVTLQVLTGDFYEAFLSPFRDRRTDLIEDITKDLLIHNKNANTSKSIPETT